ncbi:MAG: hypothetical protein ABR544_06085, partial [Gammaproteobacteria bacterium]
MAALDDILEALDKHGIDEQARVLAQANRGPKTGEDCVPACSLHEKTGSQDPVSSPSRLLKKSPVDARQGGKRRKSAVYIGVHEHFEPLSN